MKYIHKFILLVLCLCILLFGGCKTNQVKHEPTNGNLENQEDFNQSSNNFQILSTDPVEEPAIEENTEATGTVYPQKWATGTGTVGDPWAGDCLNDALTAVPDGGTIFLRAGYYQLDSTLYSSTKSYNLIGEGRGKSIIVTGMKNTSGILIDTDYCTFKGFTIDADSQEGPAYISALDFQSCDYALVEDIEAKNAFKNGLDIYAVNHSLFQNIYAHDNTRHGMHSGTDLAGRNMYNAYRDNYCWNNGVSGFDDRGTTIRPIEQCNNIYDNIRCWDNVEVGLAIGEQKGGALSNSSAVGNETGIVLYSLEDFSVNNCSSILNEEIGLILKEDSKNINLTNVIVKNNNSDDDSGSSGIYINTCSNIALTSCQSYDDRETPLQTHGIDIRGNTIGLSLLNCKLLPNAIGDIYNPNGVVVTVIIQKRGVSPSILERE